MDLLALCCVLPLLGLPASAGRTAGLIALGGAAAAVGMLDHLRLIAAMKPAPVD